MNNSYTECLVKGRTQPSMTLLAAGSVIGAAASVCAIFFVGLWGFAAFVLMCFLCGYALRHRNVEYEYLFAGNEFTVDCIYNRKSRKKMAEYTMEDIKLIAPEQAEQVKGYEHGLRKTRDFSSGSRDSRCYALICQKAGQSEKLIIEPDEKLLHSFKMTAPGKFIDRKDWKNDGKDKA